MDPQGTGPLIRNLSGEGNLCAKGQRVHVDAADHVAMPHKSTARVPAAPLPPPDFLLPPTYRTPAAGSPLTAGEALDVGYCRLVGQIGHVLAILPLTHPLVVLAAPRLLAHPVGMPDIETAHALLLAEDKDFAGPLVTQVSYLPALACAHLASCPLQHAPAMGPCLAPGALRGDLPQRQVVPPFERADAPPGDDQRRAGAGGHRRLVNLA